MKARAQPTPCHLRGRTLSGLSAEPIPHYWRVEQDPLRVYAYRRSERPGPSGFPQYELVADSADVLDLAEPVEIKLPIAEIIP